MRSLFRADLPAVVLLIIASFSGTQAQAQNVHIQIDLPEQALSESLGAVGRKSNINVLFDPAVVQGLTAPALKLTASVHELLSALLAGSGLGYRFVDEKTVTVGPIRSSQDADKSKAVKASRTTMLSSSDSAPLRLAQTETPALAQNSDAQNAARQAADGVPEILVTARKFAENIQTVPVSITQLSGVELERMTVRNVGDLQYQVPNLVFEPSTSDSNAMTIAIRGQKQNDILPTIDPSVGLYIDNVYYPRTTGLTGALIDVDRVEVLRGPQGTLYGRNTTGGALNLYTKNPTDYLEGNVSLSYGDYDTRIFSGMVNMPLTDTIAARVVVNRELHDGYGSDYLGRPLGDEDSYYARGKLRGDFDGVEVIFSTIYQQERGAGAVYKLTNPLTGPGVQEGPLNVLETQAELGLPFTPAGAAQATRYLNSFLGGDLFHTGGTSPAVSNFNSSVYALDIKAPLAGDISLRSTSSYVFVDRHVEDSDGVPIALNVQRYSTASRYIAQELQLQGGSPQFIAWAAGLYAGDESAYEYENITVFQDLNSAANPIIFAGRAHNRNQAAYAQAIWQFLPKLRLTAGIRYSRDERELDADNSLGGVCAVPAPGVEVTNTPSNPGNGPSQCPRGFGADFSKPSWLISLDYQLSDDVFAYAKLAFGYRAGGLNFRGTNDSYAFSPFQPETVLEHEVGTKLDFFDRRVQFNLALFDDDYKNQQVTGGFLTPDGILVGLTDNAGQAKIDGLEAELRFQPSHAFSFTAGSGLTAAHYVEYVDITGNHRNDPFPVPRWTGNAAANYVLDTGFGNINPSLGYHYQTASTLNAGGLTFAQAGYGLFDGRVAFNITRWNLEIAAYGRNLANKLYIAQSAEDSTIGDPRTFGVTFTKRFSEK
jgi:iron complex outermembrane recepter protein